MPRSTLALAATLLVAGCAVFPLRTTEIAPFQPTPMDSHPPPTRAVAPPVVPVPPPKPPAPEVSTPTEVIAAVVGRDLIGVVDLLGQPDLVVQQPPAMIWRYAVEGCQIDVFFYADMTTRQRRALSYRVNSQSDTPEGAERCRKLTQANDEQRAGKL